MNYTITSNNSRAALQSLGAQLTSLCVDGIEYLWQGNPSFWKGQAPVCFPIVGALKDGKATAFGKSCVMPRHGVARTQEFTVLEQNKNHIVFSLRANEKTLSQYPFDFELRVSYLLLDTLLTVEYQVINHDSASMPFAIGGHPAFRCPIGSQERFEDYQVEFEMAESRAPLRPDHKTGLVDLKQRYPVLREGRRLPLAHSLFYEDSLIFDHLQSKRVTLSSQTSSYGIELLFPDFEHLLVWSSDNDGEFVALEPWTAMAACLDETEKLEQRNGFFTLEPEEAQSFRYQCRMLK